MKCLVVLELSVMIALGIGLSRPAMGQENRSIRWTFRAGPVITDETIVTATAQVAPGWHLYSQFLQEAGPQPTRITFEKNPDFVLDGRTEENGNPVKYYDDIYGMDITQYTGTVAFEQRIRLIKPEVTVRGRIEYMVCDSHVCIPAMRDFVVKLRPTTKQP